MGSKPLRVFPVEDMPQMRNSLTALLSADGACEIVGTAESEQQAVRWSLDHEAGFDVAVVDLLLQEGSGFAAMAHLVKYQPGKVVVLSGYVTPAVKERCLSLGALAAFGKEDTAECIDFVRGLAPL
ncbi:response regulator transcription factor [Ramlibacter terrae]|uniref:Response regulator transcription factor n=1 Tax=Ramlibacter terrae TaxID=2732511 RepID=A0ABX6P4G5_9BURK|nr:response regulator transcription factor [Ramlibacter terrae]